MKKTVLFLVFILISCTTEETITPKEPILPVNYTKLKAYNNVVLYENNTSANWHRITQKLDTINNIIIQDSARYNDSNVIKAFKVASSMYYENYNNKNTNYMVYSITGSGVKYIMIAHTTNVDAVVFKKYSKESDIEFTKSSQDGEYYFPVK